MGWPIFCLSVLILCFVGVWVLSYLQSLRTRDNWRTIAHELGGQLLDQGTDPPLIDLWGEYPGRYGLSVVEKYPHPLLQRGHKRGASNVITAVYDGVPVTCFSYHFSEGSGDTETTYAYICLLAPSPVAFPKFQVRPEKLPERIAAALGSQDIQFESDSFNRRFIVQCDDRRFAYDILHPRCMEFLMRRPDICIEGDGRSLLFYQVPKGRSLAGLRGYIRRLLDFGTGFLKLIPPYLTSG